MVERVALYGHVFAFDTVVSSGAAAMSDSSWRNVSDMAASSSSGKPGG